MSFIVKLKDYDGTIWYLTSADHEGLRYPAQRKKGRSTVSFIKVQW